MINDQEKRKYPLNQIYFYLTEGCNLKCRHCWIAPKYQPPDKPLSAFDPDLFRSIIEQAKPLGLSGVKLTGGEPLLHPQILDLLEVVRSQELCLTVETNGTLCTPELAEAMKATSENSFVSVSLDGFDAKTHEWVRRVEGSFESAIIGIQNLVKVGIKPQIIMTIMRRNVSQIESFVHLAETLGAGSVKFNLIQPVARGKRMHEAKEDLGIKELIELGRWVENSFSMSTKLPLIFGHPLAFRPLGRMFRSNGSGCAVCGIYGILGVLSNGLYALCGIGQTTPELIFGNAAEDCLEDVWRDTSILNELREGLPHRIGGICSVCLMKGICLGSCIAQNYYSSKNIWSPFWYCEEAYRQGLFPKSRMIHKHTDLRDSRKDNL